MFDKTDFQRFAVSGLGAILISAASIVAVAGPVRALPLTPVAVQAPAK